METPEQFLRAKYSHNEGYENGKFGFFEVISILEEYQRKSDERTQRYGENQHYLGTQKEPIVDFNMWKL